MSDVQAVNHLILAVNRYSPIPILIFGLIGNILNIAVFTRRSLINNPCSIYFLSCTIANLCILIVGSILRCLVDGFKIDLISIHVSICRLRYFILHCSMVLSSWFIVLASIDRYCVSSQDQKRRQLSNRKYAIYSVLLTIMICLILYSHIFGFFTIEQFQAERNCYAQTGIYRIFYDFLYFTTFSFTPPILMIIIGLATFDNIHKIARRVSPGGVSNTRNGTLMKRRDRQLSSMLLLQLITIVICTLPIAIQKLYSTFTDGSIKTPYRLAIEDLVVQITRQLLFLNSALSFYV